MKRQPESELMDDPAQALAYAQADFQTMNRGFVELFEIHCASGLPSGGRVIDLGCGPADIVLRLARRYPSLYIDGVDGSAAMLALAEDARSKLDDQDSGRIRLLRVTVPSQAIEQSAYDAVVSNSFLHQLHDPAVLWQTISECGKPGARVLIMDLIRPPSETETQYIVDTYAGGEPDILRIDFYNSLRAAFTPDEIESQLTAAGFGDFRVHRVGGRHVAISGHLPN